MPNTLSLCQHHEMQRQSKGPVSDLKKTKDMEYEIKLMICQANKINTWGPIRYI